MSVHIESFDHRVMAPRKRDVVLSALEQMLQLRPDLTLSMIRIFLYTAENPGSTVGELADLCRMTDATASRSIKALITPAATEGAPPPLLKTSMSPIDSRILSVELDAEGERLVSVLEDTIRRGTLIRKAGPADRVRHDVALAKAG